MSLNSGEIVSQDLSPNAGILGTQIADKTLSLRNLSDDTFGIVQTGTVTVTALANQGSYATITHNLGTVPMVLASCIQPPAYLARQWVMCPYISFPAATSGAIAGIETLTTTAVQFKVELSSAPGDLAGDWTFKYYLLAESASPS